MNMRPLANMLFLFTLAGCASDGGLYPQHEPIKSASPTTNAVPQAVPNRSNLSPAAGAAAPPQATERTGEL